MIVRGMVVPGLGIAGTIFGVPTANLKLEQPITLASGVYLGRTSWQGTAYPSIICYGADGADKFEVHILNMTLCLTAQTLNVEIGDKVSEMINESNVDVLRAKILADVEKAKSLLGLK